MDGKKTRKNQKISDFIIYNVEHHPRDIVPFTVEKLGVSRATANRYINNLTKEGLLEGTGSTRARIYTLRDLQNEHFHIKLGSKKLAEDVILRDTVFSRIGQIPENVEEILWSGANEMVNNVLDHSGAKILK